MSKKAKLLVAVLAVIALASLSGNALQMQHSGSDACYADSVKALKDTLASRQAKLQTYQTQADSMAKLLKENTNLKENTQKIKKLIEDMQSSTDSTSSK